MPRPITKVLVANRGEIAVRVMRTCREMGIDTVAVYSEADRTAPHVLTADEAALIGPPPARESYLRGERILEVALEKGAEAVHPGYGFLAENADFAQMVQDAGLIFIGPPPAAIRAMGSKTGARQMMMDAGVPVVPGGRSGLATTDEALASAERIGYPVLIKAAMGGGGKGMRIVQRPEELPGALEAAKRESLKAFASDEVYLERLIGKPRHVEVQVLADAHGNALHLYERECSIQRRHQKVIEEAPAPALDRRPELRERMGEAAVAAAKACGYVNAGTVEFLLDDDSGEFYFLEMNTRLQVEHPVTEMVTGVDLVRQQLLIAMGERLELQQAQLRHRGHAIEVRVYAENTSAGFLPDAGRVERLERPDGPWTRVDSGVMVGSEVGVYYDPLVAKLIVWAPTRAEAIRRMARALDEYRISGFMTTIPFCRMVMDNPSFQSGDFDTGFIAREFGAAPSRDGSDASTKAAAIAAALWAFERQSGSLGTPSFGKASPSSNGGRAVKSWKQAGRIRQLR